MFVKVLIANFSPRGLLIEENQKLCQLVLTRFTIPRIVLVDELDIMYSRCSRQGHFVRGHYDRYGLMQSRHPQQPPLHKAWAKTELKETGYEFPPYETVRGRVAGVRHLRSSSTVNQSSTSISGADLVD